jgi:hypothetical protein
MKGWLPWMVTLAALGLFASDLSAQCVMCKAVAEDSAADGSLGRGLNSGILYLMAIPYLLMAFFAWFVFRKRKEAGKVNG